MTAPMTPLVLYDLAGGPDAPFFSPVATRLRFCLWTKGIPFVVKEITWVQLRNEWSGMDKPLGVENATVPFIQLPDGTYMMDSLVIAPWLDKAFPHLPSIYLPNAPLPIDTNTSEYLAALEDEAAFRRSFAWPHPFVTGTRAIFAPKIVNTFSDADVEYFKSERRLDPGEWDEILATDYEATITSLKEFIPTLEAKLASPDGYFSSATAPGFKDFHLMGVVRKLASTDPMALKRVFDGIMGEWLERMRERFREGYADMEKRDPVA